MKRGKEKNAGGGDYNLLRWHKTTDYYLTDFL